jgi:hypothetical protein
MMGKGVHNVAKSPRDGGWGETGANCPADETNEADETSNRILDLWWFRTGTLRRSLQWVLSCRRLRHLITL